MGTPLKPIFDDGAQPQADEQESADALASQSAPLASSVVPSNPLVGLTPGMQSFAVGLAKGLHKSAAYRAAYPDAADETVRKAAVKLERDPRIVRYVAHLKSLRAIELDAQNAFTNNQIQAKLSAIANFDLRRCYYPKDHERAGEVMDVIDFPEDVARLVARVEVLHLPKGAGVRKTVHLHNRLQALDLLAELRGDKAKAKGVAKPVGPRATFNINIGPGKRHKPGARTITVDPSEQHEEGDVTH